MDDTKQIVQPLRARRQPVVIGTGLVALDVVIPNDLTVDPHVCAGGTCGNVLAALAFLGWQSYPIARLGADGAAKRITTDLRQWGVNLDFVSFDEEGSTPVVVHASEGMEPASRSTRFRGSARAAGQCFPGTRRYGRSMSPTSRQDFPSLKCSSSIAPHGEPCRLPITLETKERLFCLSRPLQAIRSFSAKHWDLHIL